MGSPIGHLVPGAFFFMYGCWDLLLFCNLPDYGKRPHRSSSFQGIYVVIAATFDIAAERFVNGRLISENGKLLDSAILQHISMMVFFLLAGLAKTRIGYPIRHYEGMMAAFAFFMEAVTFSMHLSGTEDLPVRIHLILVGTILACACMAFGEALTDQRYVEKDFSNPMLLIHRRFCVARILLVVLQGAWFIAAAKLVFLDYTDPNQAPAGVMNENANLMAINSIFSFVIIICLLFLACLTALARVIISKVGLYSVIKYNVIEGCWQRQWKWQCGRGANACWVSFLVAAAVSVKSQD
eukprot:gb/GEZN01014244.1/.p1 GENE.gb/GEZN01014244.1/~~gb/GEZN01014244.1/.p1  ORF type:complete len:306 (-),score=9.50 gb/GEZN01014244.1/:46-933(-)